MGAITVFLAQFFGSILNLIYGVVENYGIAIILLTLIIKAVLIPLEYMQRIANIKQMGMSEKLKDINEKYKDDVEKRNKAMMELYKKEGVSPFAPLAGCFTLILQLFILFAILWLVSSPLTYMKKMDGNEINQKFEVILEEKKKENPELEKNKSEIANLERNKELVVLRESKKEDKEYINMDFFGINLTEIPKDKITSLESLKTQENFKIIIIPALYIVMSFISISVAHKDMEKMKEDAKKNNDSKIVKTVSKEDENKFTKEDFEDSLMMSTKMMKYILPVLIFSVTTMTPLGLALYWLINSVFDTIKIKVMSKIVDKKMKI